MWEGVPQCGRVRPSEGGCAPVREGVPQCGRVFPSVGGCAPVSEGVPQCGRVCPGEGGCVPVWEDVLQCGRMCPYICDLCVCEVWVSLSHVYTNDTHLCVHLIAGRFGHVAKAYVAKTSCSQLLLID